MTLYRHGRYQVEVGPDGAIRVRPGDSLSRYSAAIHDDFTMIHEYGRRDAGGRMVRVADPNRILAGETLYHLPTNEKAYRATPFAQPRPSLHPVRQLSPQERQQIAMEVLGKDFHVLGDNAKVLKRAIEIVQGADHASTLIGVFQEGDDASTLSEVAEILADSAGAAALSLVSAVFLGVRGAISVVDAGEVGERRYQLRGACYATVAWAFDKPIPASSPHIIRILTMSGTQPKEIAFYASAWKDATTAVVANLEDHVRKLRVKKRAYQLYWRARGDNDPRRLCRVLFEALETQLNEDDRRVWRSTETVLYPD